MATPKNSEVRAGRKIKFLDHSRTVYPVSLRQLRKLNKVMKKMDQSVDDDEQVDLMVEAAQCVLEKIDPELAADPEEVEDLIDISSFNEMIAAAMGADPNDLAGIVNQTS